jgi:hypothetical protein
MPYYIKRPNRARQAALHPASSMKNLQPLIDSSHLFNHNETPLTSVPPSYAPSVNSLDPSCDPVPAHLPAVLSSYASFTSELLGGPTRVGSKHTSVCSKESDNAASVPLNTSEKRKFICATF